MLGQEIDHFATEFQKENERLRNFIESLPEKSLKGLDKFGFGSKKEGLSQKIKKQNVLLKASFSPNKIL